MHNTIYEILIKEYPNQIELSAKRRALFYQKNGSKKIPKKYQNNRYQFDKDGKLYDTVTGEKIIANPRTAGKPRMWNVNFQAIWNQQIKYQARALITSKLKKAFKPFIKNLEPIMEYPIGIEMFIYDIEMPVDVHNKSVIYHKVFADLLVNPNEDDDDDEYITPIIIDDSSEYVNDAGRLKFCKVDNVEDIKMVIRIYKSDNK